MINEAILVGNVGKKEIKNSVNGIELTILSLATNTNYKDKNGQKCQRTTWHLISCFHKLAAFAARYIHTGDLIYVRGEIKNNKIESGEKAGQFIYSVTANDIKFLPVNRKNNDDSQGKSNDNNVKKSNVNNLDYTNTLYQCDDEVPF